MSTSSDELRRIAHDQHIDTVQQGDIVTIARALAEHLDEHGEGREEPIVRSERERWAARVHEAEADRDRLKEEQTCWRARNKELCVEYGVAVKERDEAREQAERAEAAMVEQCRNGAALDREQDAAEARLREAERLLDLVTEHLAGKELKGAEYADYREARTFLAASGGGEPEANYAALESWTCSCGASGKTADELTEHTQGCSHWPDGMGVWTAATPSPEEPETGENESLGKFSFHPCMSHADFKDIDAGIPLPRPSPEEEPRDDDLRGAHCSLCGSLTHLEESCPYHGKGITAAPEEEPAFTEAQIEKVREAIWAGFGPHEGDGEARREYQLSLDAVVAALRGEEK